jgi:hypothetical protein
MRTVVERWFRIAGALALAILLPGCLDLPDDSKALLTLFLILVSALIVLNGFLILLLFFYFLPFTKPTRKRKRKR